MKKLKCDNFKLYFVIEIAAMLLFLLFMSRLVGISIPALLKSNINFTVIVVLLSLAEFYPMRGGNVDLSVNAILGMCSLIYAYMMNHYQTGILTTLLLGALLGAINGILVVKSGIFSTVITFCTGTVFFTLSRNLFPNTEKLSSAITLRFHEILSSLYLSPRSFMVLGCILVFICFVIFNRYSRFNIQLFATGKNPEKAQFLGVNTKRTQLFAHILAGIISAVAGIFFVLRYSYGQASAGTDYELYAILLNIPLIYIAKNSKSIYAVQLVLLGLFVAILRTYVFTIRLSNTFLFKIFPSVSLLLVILVSLRFLPRESQN